MLTGLYFVLFITSLSFFKGVISANFSLSGKFELVMSLLIILNKTFPLMSTLSFNFFTGMLYDVLALLGFKLFISLINSSWVTFENRNLFPFTLSFIFNMLGWD